jgi:hypothetical protein
LKTFISLIFVSILSVGAFFAFQSDATKQACIEDCFADTANLFQIASSFFGPSVASNQTKSEQLELDAKLQALLPSIEIDLSYQSTPQETIISSISTSAQQPLLPNLFIKQVPGPSTRFNGSVHSDKDNKVVGAEINISIPTNIR